MELSLYILSLFEFEERSAFLNPLSLLSKLSRDEYKGLRIYLDIVNRRWLWLGQHPTINSGYS